MNSAYKMQNFQDWFTQQWVILLGRKFDPHNYPWLIGPFGDLNGIGEEFYIISLKKNLIVQRNSKIHGLLSTIDALNLNQSDLDRLSNKIIDFYEKTERYNLEFNVKWNPFFNIFGYLVNLMWKFQ